MEVKYVYFDNDLDIAPGLNESITYNPGAQFIMHWDTTLTQRVLLRMYNVRFVREIDFARNVSISHNDPSINQESISKDRSAADDFVATSPTESWADPNPYNYVQEDTTPNPTTYDPAPSLPKLNEICICEDTPDPTCPVHRNRGI